MRSKVGKIQNNGRTKSKNTFNRLKTAKIISQWAGLRPYRLNGVRLEHEMFQGKLNVIHNYGHGGCGVSLSWGCAGTVVQLVKEIQLLPSHL